MAKKKTTPTISTNRRTRKQQRANEKRAQFFLKPLTALEKFAGFKKVKPQ